MNVKKAVFALSLLTAFLALVGCDDDAIKLVDNQYYTCNHAVIGGGALMLPFPDTNYANAPANEPCLSKYAPVAQHDWTAHSAYQADIARFDIATLQGVANAKGTLEGRWLFIYDFAGQGSADNGRLNRQICHVSAKQNENHVYQADCPQLQSFGDLRYNPNTASLSNDGIGQLPNDAYVLGQEVALNDLIVQSFSKIDGVAQFTRKRSGDQPAAVSEHAFQLVRLGETDQALGTLQLREVAALVVDSSAPYTTSWQITAFKESLQFAADVRLSEVNQLDKKQMKGLHYEFAISDEQGLRNVFVTQAQVKNWLKVDTQQRDYYCFDNGSVDGCSDIVKYPKIDQFIKYESLSDYVSYSNRKAALSQANEAVDASLLLAQSRGHFDILRADNKALEIHFRYEEAAEINQEGLLELVY